jgi:OOP family OmpA-OmpF porin
MKKGGWLVVLGLLAAAAAGPAAAQDPGIYVGGSAGYGQAKNTCKNLVVPCDANDSTWRFFGGYQFNRYWAAELGYGDLGAVTGAGIGNTGVPVEFRFAIEEAWDLTAVFLIPVTSRLSALGRVGMYRARTTADFNVAGSPPTHDAGTNSGFSYGAGAEFRLGPIGLRAEWQRYENVGVASTGEDDIDVFSLGALWRF